MTKLKEKHLYQVHLHHLQSTQDSHKTKQAWKQAEIFPSHPVKGGTVNLRCFSKRSICIQQLNNSTPHTFKLYWSMLV